MKKSSVFLDTEHKSHFPLDMALITLLWEEYSVSLFGSLDKIEEMKQGMDDNGIPPEAVTFLEKRDPFACRNNWEKLQNLLIARKNVKTLRRAIQESPSPLHIITSFSNNFYTLSLLPALRKFPSVAFVHNLRDWVNIQGEEDPEKKNRVFLNQKVLKRLDAVLFIEDYLKKNAERWIKKPSFVFPYRVTSHEELEFRRKALRRKNIPTFVISGTVSKRSRDYSLVFSALSSVRKPFSLVLLGHASERDVVELGKRTLGEKLVSFESYLSEREYKEHLFQAHFLIGCVKDGVYGEWQGTGIEFDGPAFGIPTLIPANAIPENQNGLFLRYDSESALRSLCQKGIAAIEAGTYEKDFLSPAMKKAEYFYQEKWKQMLLSQIPKIKGFSKQTLNAKNGG